MKIRLALIAALVFVVALVAVPHVGAASCYDGGSLSDYCKLDSANEIGVPQKGLKETIQNIVSILGLVAGALSVIFLILGGINYITSEGDSKKLAGAKGTITYAIIGLIISILAPFIVGLVLQYSPQ